MAQHTDLAALVENSPDHEWVRDAACGDLGLEKLDMFFVEAGRTLSKEVVAMCGDCPVRVDCLSHAQFRELAGGYFGGVSPSKRRKLGSDVAHGSGESAAASERE